MLSSWLFILVATLAINTIFVISLLATLNGEQRAMFLFATVVLAGGLFFTMRIMQRLSRHH
jgi:hypothetical protein